MSHDESLGALVHEYVRTQCDVLRDSREAIAARDESVVHPARVAIRRLRATLRTFGAVYDPDDGSAFGQELRWAGNLLGDVRDLQVLAERFADEDSPATPAPQQVLAAQIARNRAHAWGAVTDGLGGARGAALFEVVARWRDEPPFSATAGRPATRAHKRVAKADARLKTRLAHAEAAWDAAPEQTGTLLHDARKAAKRLRYAVELALPILGDRAEQTIERLRALQDVLGAHQDAVVALAFLQRIDLDTQSRETALALQDLIGYTRAAAEDVGGTLREAEPLRR